MGETRRQRCGRWTGRDEVDVIKWWMALAVAALAGCGTTPTAPDAEGWRAVAIPGKTHTHYAWVQKDGRRALAARADRSASMWRRHWHVPADQLRQLVEAAGPLGVTFHRAIDLSSDWRLDLETIEPLRGARMPATVRISEVLPAPLAPTSATTCPAPTSRLTRSSACAKPAMMAFLRWPDL